MKGDNMTYLRVVSDGTPGGTHVYTEEEQEVGGVEFMSCEIRAHPGGGTHAVAVMRVVHRGVEISAESSLAESVATHVVKHSVVVEQGIEHIDPSTA